MAFSCTVNFQTTSEGNSWWKLKELLVAGGWSVARSGDGLSAFSNSGDVLSPGGPYPITGPNSLDHTNAWMELRQPSGATPRRSFLIQKTSTDGAWRVWYSSNGTGFTGGSPSATVRGTAADEQGIVNTPSGTTIFVPYNVAGVFYLDVVVGGSSEGYSFFWGCRRFSTQGYGGVLAIDVLSGANALDQDPAVIVTNFDQDSPNFASNGCLAFTLNVSTTNGGAQGWYKKGLTGANFVPYPIFGWGQQEGSLNTIVARSNARSSQISTNDFQEIPCLYIRGGTSITTENGYKGQSVLFRALLTTIGQHRNNVGRTRVSVGTISIPWDGATVPLF